MKYLHWKEEQINEITEETVTKMYDNGFVFTRINKGVMHQTRSVRINLTEFELTSENRRILRKGENVMINEFLIPYSKYDWSIGKIAKDFYDKKAPGDFTVNKIKEIITTPHNFNTLFEFEEKKEDGSYSRGYVICHKNSNIIHYCYPFYEIDSSNKDMGLIMMTKAISEAKTQGLKYFYLGSLQRPSDTYKLQFSGIEWFDGNKWQADIEEAKKILNN